MSNDFSVLISVYNQEEPEYLNLALESIFKQTLIPREVILVKDGTLTRFLDEVVNFWEKREKGILRVFQLKENVGLAKALNFGLKYCSCEIVARMDSDDIAVKNRFEKQIVFMKEKQIDISGAYIEERDEKMKHIFGERKVPLSHEDIIRYFRWRNPMNHVTVMFKKNAVLAVGGYPEELRKLQDYGLWGKMIMAGCKFGNIPETLVLVRTGDDFICRRGGLGYFKYEVAVLRYMRRIRYIGFLHFVANLLIRFLVRVSPVYLRAFLYGKMRSVGAS